MNLTTDDLYLIIGVKEAELVKLRLECNRLQAENNGLKAELQRITKDAEAEEKEG